MESNSGDGSVTLVAIKAAVSGVPRHDFSDKTSDNSIS